MRVSDVPARCGEGLLPARTADGAKVCIRRMKVQIGLKAVIWRDHRNRQLRAAPTRSHDLAALHPRFLEAPLSLLGPTTRAGRSPLAGCPRLCARTRTTFPLEYRLSCSATQCSVGAARFLTCDCSKRSLALCSVKCRFPAGPIRIVTWDFSTSVIQPLPNFWAVLT